MRTSASRFRTDQRVNPTDAEAALWAELRNRKLGGYKFARQVTIGVYTADFVCRTRKLVIEVDGREHEYKNDEARTQFLNEQGYSVVRFWNEEVMLDRINVLDAIIELLEGRTPDRVSLNFSPALPPERVRS